MTFLIADGVVPSNEDRGYVLRRIMRRAILQGRHTLELEPGFLRRYADVVTELMGADYPELGEHREDVAQWLDAEEESFGRTLDPGEPAPRRADRPRPRSPAPRGSAARMRSGSTTRTGSRST